MARVAAVGQVTIGDVGAGPYIAPTSYGLIINTNLTPTELKAASDGAKAGKKYNIKITDNAGVERTYVVTGVDSSAGWYTTITIGQDLTKVFTTSRSLAFVMSEQTTTTPPTPPPSTAPPPPAPITPPTIASYSDWTPLSAMLTDFTTQTAGIVTSLGDTTNRPNPSPYMTALDTDVNAIRDQVKIRQLQALNSQNIQDATTALAEATDMSDELKNSQNQADVLRRQIAMSANQATSYQSRFLPLQILAGTLAIVLFVYFLAGFVLPMAVASTLAMVMLAGGLGAAIYFAVKQT
jgi:hypothetical protein